MGPEAEKEDRLTDILAYSLVAVAVFFPLMTIALYFIHSIIFDLTLAFTGFWIIFWIMVDITRSYKKR